MSALIAAAKNKFTPFRIVSKSNRKGT